MIDPLTFFFNVICNTLHNVGVKAFVISFFVAHKKKGVRFYLC